MVKNVVTPAASSIRIVVLFSDSLNKRSSALLIEFVIYDIADYLG